MSANRGTKNALRASEIRAFVGSIAAALLVLLTPAAGVAAPFAFIGNNGENTVSVIDLATKTVDRTVVVGANPGPMALSPDGAHMYVFSGDGSLSAIDTQTYAVVTTPLGLSFINGIEVTPDGSFIYATGGSSNEVWIIDAATYSIVDSFPVPNDPPTCCDNHTGMLTAVRLRNRQIAGNPCAMRAGEV